MERMSYEPVIIGAHGRGMLFHGGGGISGGTTSSTAATIDWTIPMPMLIAAEQIIAITIARAAQSDELL